MSFVPMSISVRCLKRLLKSPYSLKILAIINFLLDMLSNIDKKISLRKGLVLYFAFFTVTRSCEMQRTQYVFHFFYFSDDINRSCDRHPLSSLQCEVSHGDNS